MRSSKHLKGDLHGFLSKLSAEAWTAESSSGTLSTAQQALAVGAESPWYGSFVVEDQAGKSFLDHLEKWGDQLEVPLEGEDLGIFEKPAVASFRFLRNCKLLRCHG